MQLLSPINSRIHSKQKSTVASWQSLQHKLLRIYKLKFATLILTFKKLILSPNGKINIPPSEFDSTLPQFYLHLYPCVFISSWQRRGVAQSLLSTALFHITQLTSYSDYRLQNLKLLSTPMKSPTLYYYLPSIFDAPNVHFVATHLQ